MSTKFDLSVLSLKQAQQCKEGLLLPISCEGTVLRPGDIAIAEADGHPLLICSSGNNIIAAHSSSLYVLPSIVEMFQRRKIRPFNIFMRIQMYTRKSIADEFAKMAREEGVLWIRATNPIAEFLTAQKVPIGRKRLITVTVQ